MWPKGLRAICEQKVTSLTPTADKKPVQREKYSLTAVLVTESAKSSKQKVKLTYNIKKLKLFFQDKQNRSRNMT